MSRPAIFFDRDNTLIANHDYLSDAEQVRLIDGAAEAIARARHMGYAIVVVSNQSGVARGLHTEQDVRDVNDRMEQLLQSENPLAIIDRQEFCPYHPQGVVPEYRLDSDLRKPAPGMLLKAADELDLDLTRSWLIGDALRDLLAGHAAGCRTILFNDPSLQPSEAAADVGSAAEAAETECGTLAQAIDYIAAHRNDRPSDPHGDRGVNADRTIGNDRLGPADDARFDALGQAIAASVGRTASPPAAASAGALRSGPGNPSASQDTRRTEILLQQILEELKRGREQPVHEFAVSKMLAGITQILAVGSIVFAYVQRTEPGWLEPTLLVALLLQTMTIALLIMSRQK